MIRIDPTIEEIALGDDGLVPNNPRLPLRLYRQALACGPDDPERAIIAHLAEHGWGGAWVDGIYGYHHYHADAHEVLVIARGWARVQFGGPGGPMVEVAAGDAVLIPAGVSHCRMAASEDLSVVGAYPPGQEQPDLSRATAAARERALALIASCADPPRDPIYGSLPAPVGRSDVR